MAGLRVIGFLYFQIFKKILRSALAETFREGQFRTKTEFLRQLQYFLR
jgi:hypothetical protein